ncbi:zinc ribbon domain-containing protein [Haploplasma axanthum]|uniref:Double zinc ribbon n=1 Tax=Haploplasma axanthum TaxID=29552 RepID=A0A449BCS0_HAPAX|nr:zinc ribbon domain-containing protein [Haploplasma axanthum]VEU80225.1 Double zinc ribbon [Haploplasma axanthum]
MRCIKCFKEIPDDSKFCMYCGEDTSIAKEVNCNVCGSEIPDGALFCPTCGAKAKSIESIDNENTKSRKKVSDVIARYLKSSISIIFGMILLIALFLPTVKFNFSDLSPEINNIKLDLSFSFTKNIVGIKYLFEDNTFEDFYEYVDEEVGYIADRYDLNPENLNDRKKIAEILVDRINPAYLYSIQEYSEITTIQIFFFVVLVISQMLLLVLIPFLIIIGIISLVSKDESVNKGNNIVQYLSFVALGLVMICNGLFLATNNFEPTSTSLTIIAIMALIMLAFKIFEKIVNKQFILRNLIKSVLMLLGTSLVFLLVINTGIKYQYKYQNTNSTKKELIVTESAKSFSGTLDKIILDNNLELTKEFLIDSFFDIVESNLSKKTKIYQTKFIGNNAWTAVEEAGSEMKILITLTAIISIATLIVLATVLLMVLIRFVYQAENRSLFLNSLQILGIILIIAQITLLIITSLTMNQYFGFFGLDKGVRSVYTSVSIAQYFGLVLTIALLVFNIVFKEKSKNS